MKSFFNHVWTKIKEDFSNTRKLIFNVILPIIVGMISSHFYPITKHPYKCLLTIVVLVSVIAIGEYFFYGFVRGFVDRNKIKS